MTELYKNHDISLENKIHPHVIENFTNQKKYRAFDLTENPLATWLLLDQIQLDLLEETKQLISQRELQERDIFSKLSIRNFDGKFWNQIKKMLPAFNAERIINEKFEITKRENVPKTSI